MCSKNPELTQVQSHLTWWHSRCFCRSGLRLNWPDNRRLLKTENNYPCYSSVLIFFFFAEHLSRVQRIISIFVSPTCLLFALVRVASVVGFVFLTQMFYSHEVSGMVYDVYDCVTACQELTFCFPIRVLLRGSDSEPDMTKCCTCVVRPY